jgi:hypothetical protein
MDRVRSTSLGLVLLLAAFFQARPAAAGSGKPVFFTRFTFSQEPALGFCPPLDAVFAAEIALNASGEYVFTATVLELGDGFPPEPGCRDDIPVAVKDSCAKETDLPPRTLSLEEAEVVTATFARVLERVEPEPDPICPGFDPCVIRVFTFDSWRFTDYVCDSPRLRREDADVLVDLLERLRGAEPRLENGDTNGDGLRDLSDAVYLLTALFLGGPLPVPIDCQIPVPCAADDVVVLQNGDVNADRERDVSDAVSLLVWLFLGGDEPAPICFCRENTCALTCELPGTCIPIAMDDLVYACTSELKSCEDVLAVYELVIAGGRRCRAELGCHIVFGHCGIGLGGCYHAVNRTVRQEHLDALAQRFVELNGTIDCVRPVCACAPPPRDAVCADQACVPVE